MNNQPSFQAYTQADATAGDPEDHDIGFLNADDCGWVAFLLIVGMVVSLLVMRFWDRRRKLHLTCPNCLDEAFVVKINSSGSSPTEWGTAHWWDGDGKCTTCGYKGFYSDSSI